MKLEQTATEIITRMQTRRFVTLTIKQLAGESLSDAIARLRGSYKTLTRRSFWREHVTGGFYAVEIGYNVKTGCWHPHMHLVVSGSYMPQAALADEWEAITGNSRIVDVRAINDPKRAGRYVAKYVLKPYMLCEIPSHRLAEFARTVAGMRLYQTFGDQHRQKLKEKPKLPAPEPGRSFVPIGRMIAAYWTGDPVAEKLFHALKAMPRSWRLAFGLPDRDHPEAVDTEEATAPARVTALMHELTHNLRHGPPPPPPQPPPPTLYD